MIVHRGRGGLIAIILFLCFLGSEFYTRIHYRDDTYYQHHPWPKLAACLVAAALVWWLSPGRQPETVPSPSQQQWIVSSSRDASALEPESSSFKLSLFRETDSLLFIPVKYWPLLLCFLGIVLYFVPGVAIP
jgi:hypothetical protein